MTTTTPNVGMILPDVSVTTGPLWATYLNAAFTRIDAHDHTSGNGVRIPASALNITATVDFNASGGTTGNDAIGLRSARFVNAAALLAGATDVGSLFRFGGDLYWNFDSTTHVKLTNGAAINTAGLVNSIWVTAGFAGNHTIGAADTDTYFLMSTSGGARTLTLPSAAAVPGRYYVVQAKSSANPVILAPNGTDTIDTGAAGASLTLPSVTMGSWIVISDSVSSWTIHRSSQEINGASVPAGGALVTGNTLQVSGTNALSYSALNLAGGANFVTGVLPAAQVGAPVGDVGGNQAATVISTITGTAGAVSLVASTFARPTAGGGVGTVTTFQSQDGGGGGGAFTIQSGSDGTANETTAGAIKFNRGSRNLFEMTQGSPTDSLFRVPTRSTNGAGGTLTVNAQDGRAAGAGGGLFLAAGAAAGATFNGGQVSIAGGAGLTTGVGGAATLVGGSSSGAGAGGAVSLTGGASATGRAGAVLAGWSGNSIIQAVDVAAGSTVVALGRSATVTTTEIPGVANNCIYIGSTIDPTNAPVSGCLLYFRGSDNTLHVWKAGSGAPSLII